MKLHFVSVEANLFFEWEIFDLWVIGTTFPFNGSQFSFGSKLLFILVKTNFPFSGGCFSHEWKPVNLWVKILLVRRKINSNLSVTPTFPLSENFFPCEWKSFSIGMDVTFPLSQRHFPLYWKPLLSLFLSQFYGVETTFAWTRSNGCQSWYQTIPS